MTTFKPNKEDQKRIGKDIILKNLTPKDAMEKHNISSYYYRFCVKAYKDSFKFKKDKKVVTLVDPKRDIITLKKEAEETVELAVITTPKQGLVDAKRRVVIDKLLDIQLKAIEKLSYMLESETKIQNITKIVEVTLKATMTLEEEAKSDKIKTINISEQINQFMINNGNN